MIREAPGPSHSCFYGSGWRTCAVETCRFRQLPRRHAGLQLYAIPRPSFCCGNVNDGTLSLLSNKGIAVMTISCEFSLYVHKALQNARHPDLYTIAVWDRLLDLRGICFARPVDNAVAAFRNVLEEAGKLAEVERWHDADRRNRREHISVIKALNPYPYYKVIVAFKRLSTSWRWPGN